MSSIRVKWQTANAVTDLYGSCQRDLSDVIASVRSVRSNRYMRGRNFTAIYRSLDNVISDMENEKQDIRNLRSSLEEVLKTYEAYENRISGQIKGGNLKEVMEKSALASLTGSAVLASTTPSGNWQKSWMEQLIERLPESFQWKWKDTLKIVAQVGIVGKGISTIGTVCTEGWSAKTGIGLAKDIVSVGGTLTKGSNVKWGEELFGLNNALKGLDKSGFGATFKSSLKKSLVDDLTFSKTNTLGKNIKVATKWAGHALSFASNAIDNYNEFKGTGNVARGIAETVIETGVDIGVGAIATAGVSAVATGILTSLGVTVAAPAVAIGVGAVTVTWVANSVCKWLTGGKKISEAVSDFVCDKAEAKYKNIKNTVAKVKEGFGSMVKWGSSLLSFA